MKRILFFMTCLMVWSSTGNAKRLSKEELRKVDEYVVSLGPLDGYHLKQIVDTLTHRQTMQTEKMIRALYAWEAMNIYYNCAGQRRPKTNNPTASAALNERKATHEGYANLFKAMCDLARIKCEVVPGIAKFSPSNIGKLSEKWNKHTWNVVQLDGVWYPVDIAWSAGITDRKFRYFTPKYNDAWYFTDKELFALSHFPEDKKWQMIDSPMNKSNFTFAPIVGPAAINNQVYPAEGVRGNLKGKSDTTKELIFEVGDPSLIRTVSVSAPGNTKDTLLYTIKDNMLRINMPMHSAGTRYTSIFINDTLAYIYKAQVAQSNIVAKAKAAAQKQKDKEKKEAALAKEREAKAAKLEKDKANKLELAEKQKLQQEKDAEKLAAQKAKEQANKEKQAAKAQADKDKKLADKEKAQERALSSKEKEQAKKVADKEKAESKKEAEKNKAQAKKETRKEKADDSEKEEKKEKKKKKDKEKKA